MMTRMGIGKLILYDYDKVEIANMNRMFYTPDQVGLSKVEAASITLKSINPGTQIEFHNGNISLGASYDHLENSILKGGLEGQRCSLV